MRYALNNSLSAIQRGWVWLWPNCPPSSALAKVTARDPFGNAVCSVTVRREVSELALILLNESIRRGYRIFAAQTGSFNCRKIAGTNSPSNHSGGLAIDINWTINPQRRPLTTNIPQWMIDMWERYGWRWGGYWNLPDPMHFEFMGGPQDAAEMTALARSEIIEKNTIQVPGVEDMAGAIGFILPPAMGEIETLLKDSNGKLRIPRGKLVNIPVPPNDGAGAAKGAKCWLQLRTGWGSAYIYQLAQRGLTFDAKPRNWSDLLPFVDLYVDPNQQGHRLDWNGVVYNVKSQEFSSWPLADGITNIEMIYESEVSISGLVEWR
jgi:hypothetical protein